jgi:DNA-directed RNA polymerase specialized sigma24 family protein
MASRAEREVRDALILRLHLAGVPYRDISKRSGLSLGAVHKVVRRELAKAARRRDDLEDDAVTAHLERLDSLFAAKLLQGDAG